MVNDSRQYKPVYLNGDIRQSFILRGACDEGCTQVEIGRHDGESLYLDPERCVDDGSVRWYRKLFEARKPDPDATLQHREFLHHWDLVVETDGRLRPALRSSCSVLHPRSARHCLVPWLTGNGVATTGRMN